MSKAFEAVLIRPEGTGTWTYLTVPFRVQDEFGSHGQVRVKGTINGHSYRSTLMPAGDGKHYLVVKKEIRDQIHATAGSTVHVEVELDLEERSVVVPHDLQTALEGNPQGQDAFAQLSYSRKTEYVDWVESSKRAETRQRRIEAAVDRIASGLPLKG